MKNIILLVALIFLSLIHPNVYAKAFEVKAKGEYVMGDRDSKADARMIALEHAKLLAVEKIGTYLESEKVVSNNQLTKNEIRTYTSAVLKTVVLSEDMRMLENKTAVLSIEIKADVDVGVLENKIKEIRSDDTRNQQISSLQKENIRLLREMESISNQLKNDQKGQYRSLLQERENVLNKIYSNQNAIRIAFEKGALQNLAKKNKDVCNEDKINIDKALQFIADNTVFTVDQPQIRHNGNKSDLIVNVEWKIKNADELLDKLSLFYDEPMINVFDDIPISSAKFKGINKETLANYFKSRVVRFKIGAGKWGGSIDLVNNADNISYIKTKMKTSLTIPDIPTDQLNQITGIECKVVAEPLDG